jgi:hypothetical protein
MPQDPSTAPETHYPLKVQAIRSQGNRPKLYVYIPIPLAAAIGLNPGDSVQWELLDRNELHLIHLAPSPPSARQRSRSKP